MSSKLKRRSKANLPLGYTKREDIAIKTLSSDRERSTRLIADTTFQTKLICYYVLRWKYGFGKKRYETFQAYVQAHIDYSMQNRLDMADYQRVINEKCKLDIHEIANELSFRELLSLTNTPYPKDLNWGLAMKHATMESIELYFDYIASALKQMKWSNPEINRYFGYCIELMKDVHKEYYSTTGTEDTIFEETGFRLVGGY